MAKTNNLKEEFMLTIYKDGECIKPAFVHTFDNALSIISEYNMCEEIGFIRSESKEDDSGNDRYETIMCLYPAYTFKIEPVNNL